LQGMFSVTFRSVQRDILLSFFFFYAGMQEEGKYPWTQWWS